MPDAPLVVRISRAKGNAPTFEPVVLQTVKSEPKPASASIQHEYVLACPALACPVRFGMVAMGWGFGQG